MKDKSLLMAEAISYIDDRFLEEAHPEARGLTQAKVNRNKMMRRVAAVACLCLVAIGVARLPALGDMSVGGNMAPEAEGPMGSAFADYDNGDGNGGNQIAPEGVPNEEKDQTADDEETESEAEIEI